MKPYVIALLGNREVSDRQVVFDELLSVLENRVTFEYDDFPVFLCGGYGDFGNISSEAIDVFRKRHPELEAEKLFVTPYMTPDYSKILEYMQEFYDEIIYPSLDNVPPQLAIIRRDEWMIDRCDLLITYIENPLGNTKQCIKYAFRTYKNIIFIDSGEIAKSLCWRRKRKRKSR